ncbi:MAG: hypothetical protein R3D71_07740 [Rickettsiales bacterium]
MRSAIVVALLLDLLIWSDVAIAADKNRHSSENVKVELKRKKMEKLLIMMNTVGVDNPKIISFIQIVNKHTKDGYLTLHKREMYDGTLSLRYKLSPKINSKQIELRYVPDDSNFEYSAKTNSLMVNYKFRF